MQHSASCVRNPRSDRHDPFCVLPVLCALRTPRLWEQQDDAERANRRECQSMFCDVILL